MTFPPLEDDVKRRRIPQVTILRRSSSSRHPSNREHQKTPYNIFAFCCLSLLLLRFTSFSLLGSTTQVTQKPPYKLPAGWLAGPNPTTTTTIIIIYFITPFRIEEPLLIFFVEVIFLLLLLLLFLRHRLHIIITICTHTFPPSST